MRSCVPRCEAAYLNDKLVLVLADSQEPWSGVLIPTERRFHSSIQDEFPQMKCHPVLGKWLYLKQNTPDFEEIVARVIGRVQSHDIRFGVEPKPKKFNRR